MCNEYICICIYKMGFPDSSVGKESTCNSGDTGSIPGSGRSPGEGIGYPLQYSGLENSMDCIVCEVAKSRTQLSDFHFQRGEPRPVFTENGLWLNSRKYLELSNSWIVNCLVRNEPPVTKSGIKKKLKSRRSSLVPGNDSFIDLGLRLHRHVTKWTWDSMDMCLSKLQEMV